MKRKTTTPAIRRGLTGTFLVIAALALSGCAGDQLGRHAINKLSEGWYTWGNVKTEKVTDTSVPGGKVQRVVIPTKPAQPWDDGVVVTVVKPVKKGDVIVFGFWARAAVLPEGNDFIQLVGRVFEQAPPRISITPESNYLLGKAWKFYHASGTAEKDYVAGQIAGGLLIGSNAQTIDFGPVYVSDFGPGFDVSTLEQLRDVDKQ